MVGSTTAINGLHRTKTEEGWLCSLGLSWNVNLFLPSDIRRLWFLGLELHQWLSWASSVQVADCDLHNHVSHSLRINLSGYLLIYIFSWFCFSGDPWIIFCTYSYNDCAIPHSPYLSQHSFITNGTRYGKIIKCERLGMQFLVIFKVYIFILDYLRLMTKQLILNFV